MSDYNKIVSDLVERHRLAEISLKQNKKILGRELINQRDTRQALDLIQTLVERVQNEIHKKISHVVSRCLSLVFEEPYEFVIEFEKKRSRTEAKMTLVRNGITLTDPYNEVGGGVIDVASFALRLSCLFLSQPVRRRLIILDEPFKFVHPPSRRPRLVDMLNALSDEFDVQFVMVTGIDELMMGEVVELSGTKDR